MSNEEKPVQQPAAEKDQEVLALHRKLAAETLRANQGWQRYEEANQDRNSLRAKHVVPAAGVQGDKQTDLSKRLRGWDKNSVATIVASDLHAAADEIDRYYNGMLNWKATAEAKDAAIVQPDSGRDAALDDLTRYSLNQIEEEVQPCEAGEFIMYDDVKELLAANPAPSSDAALLTALKDIAEACNCCGDRADLAQIAQDALDAHPANGAQAGPTDTDRINFLGRMGFTNLGRYSGMMQVVWLDDILDRHLTNGKDAREALDAAILAAAKKGG